MIIGREIYGACDVEKPVLVAGLDTLSDLNKSAPFKTHLENLWIEAYNLAYNKLTEKQNKGILANSKLCYMLADTDPTLSNPRTIY